MAPKIYNFVYFSFSARHNFPGPPASQTRASMRLLPQFMLPHDGHVYISEIDALPLGAENHVTHAIEHRCCIANIFACFWRIFRCVELKIAGIDFSVVPRDLWGLATIHSCPEFLLSISCDMIVCTFCEQTMIRCLARVRNVLHFPGSFYYAHGAVIVSSSNLDRIAHCEAVSVTGAFLAALSAIHITNVCGIFRPRHHDPDGYINYWGTSTFRGVCDAILWLANGSLEFRYHGDAFEFVRCPEYQSLMWVQSVRDLLLAEPQPVPASVCYVENHVQPSIAGCAACLRDEQAQAGNSSVSAFQTVPSSELAPADPESSSESSEVEGIIAGLVEGRPTNGGVGLSDPPPRRSDGPSPSKSEEEDAETEAARAAHAARLINRMRAEYNLMRVMELAALDDLIEQHPEVANDPEYTELRAILQHEAPNPIDPTIPLSEMVAADPVLGQMFGMGAQRGRGQGSVPRGRSSTAPFRGRGHGRVPAFRRPFTDAQARARLALASRMGPIVRGLTRSGILTDLSEVFAGSPLMEQAAAAAHDIFTRMGNPPSGEEGSSSSIPPEEDPELPIDGVGESVPEDSAGWLPDFLRYAEEWGNADLIRFVTNSDGFPEGFIDETGSLWYVRPCSDSEFDSE